MTVAIASLAERAAGGAAWLDRQVPVWFGLVDLDRLDMASLSRDLLSHLFAEVDPAAPSPLDVADLGFALRPAEPHTDTQHAALTRVWRQEITRRRLQAGIQLAPVAVRVARGVTLLDAHRPGWADRVDVAMLDEEIIQDCMLAQLYGTYAQGTTALALSEVAVVGYGFDRHPELETEAVYPQITKAWQQAILARRAPSPDPAAVARAAGQEPGGAACPRR